MFCIKKKDCCLSEFQDYRDFEKKLQNNEESCMCICKNFVGMFLQVISISLFRSSKNNGKIPPPFCKHSDTSLKWVS